MIDNLKDKLCQWLLTEAAVPLLVTDASGAVVFSNPGAQALFGYSEVELMGFPVALLIPDPNSDIRRQDNANDGHDQRKHLLMAGHAIQARRRDGSEFLAELSFSTMENGLAVATIQDVTERKQAEAALLESEAALKEAQRLSGLGNWKWDLRTGVHTWSEEIFHIYGRDPALPPAVYPEVQQYFTPSSWARLAAAVEKAMAEGTPYVCDAEVVRPDGSHRWILARGTAARDAVGNIVYLHGTVQDISERKQAEKSLRESERRYRELVQNANSAIIRWSRDGTITFFNEYAQSFFGWHADEAVGQNVGILVPERETTGADLSRLVQDIVDHPVRYVNNINENVCRDGRRVWMTWSNHAILDEHGQVSEILAVGSDITERKHAETVLAEREAQYRAVIETSADGFWIVDGEGRILAVNDAYVLRSGYSRDELLAMRVPDLEARESAGEISAHIQMVLASGSDRFETWHRAKSGEVWPVEINVSHWASAGYRLFVFIRDITERKRAESALKSLQEEMEQLTRFQVASQTVAAIAHELNQPLSAVSSYAEAALRLLRAGNPQPEKLTHALEGSAAQAQRAGRVLGELFAFMRKGEIQTEPLDINEVVQSVLDRIDTNGYGGFQSRLELHPNLSQVSANRLQLEKVMQNLIRNGLEAMHEAGIDTRSIHVTVRTSSDGGMAQVTVQDSGPGIDDQTLHRIFDPFFTTKPKGLGMGLAVSRAIIESHGGQLWVESEPGTGASFHFTLPFAT